LEIGDGGIKEGLLSLRWGNTAKAVDDGFIAVVLTIVGSNINKKW
jgi:hypothetical protein